MASMQHIVLLNPSTLTTALQPQFMIQAPTAGMGGFLLPGLTTAVPAIPTQPATPIMLQTIPTISTPNTNQISVSNVASTPVNQFMTTPVSNTNNVLGIADSPTVGGKLLGGGMALPPGLNCRRMENTATDKPVAVKVEVCGDTGERYMDSAYQARESDSDNTHQAIANSHSSSCVFDNCDTLESVHAVNQPYTCGSCSSRFTSICLLHEHIEVHGLGGSYHYNNRLRTAFPKYDSVCCMNHTDNSSLCAMGDSFQVGESTSYEISGNRLEINSIKECTADNVEVKSNETTGGTLSLQIINSDISEKTEKFVYNSETNNTSSVCVKTEKDNDSDVQNELYETRDSSANENFETRVEFQNSSNDEYIAESTGVKTNEKMNCVKTKKIRKGDGPLIDKLRMKRNSVCLYENRRANGRVKKKKLTQKKHSFKQTELCIDKKTEISSDKKTEISSDKKTEISCDKKTEIGCDENIEINSDKNTEISSDKNTEISSDKKTEIKSDRKRKLTVKVERYNGTSYTQLLPNGSPVVSELDSEFQNCTCFKCNLVFQSEIFLESHLEKHEGKLVCDCCSESFPSLTEFEKHVLLGEGKDIKAIDILYCSYCNMMFTEIKGLKAHICLSAEDSKLKRQTVRNGTGTANKKGKQIGVLQYIPLHKDKIAKQTTVKTSAKNQCEICDKEFENEYFLVMHKIVHTYCYKCSKCNLCFISQFDRDQHNTTCINLDEYWTCQICGKHFSSKSRLSHHIDIHKDTKDLQCNLCGAVFKTKSTLVSHEKRCPALEKREKKISCNQCGRKFYAKHSLKKHMRTVHSDVRTFICEICGASFKCNGILRKHRNTHRDDKKRFKCNICGVGFTQPMSLKRHNKIHLQQCMEKCTYCGKTFRESWNLKAHTRQHTGEKPYKCDSCGQGFTHNVSRKAHMKKCRKTLN